MNFKTISKILVAILGFLGIIFLVRILAVGDEAIKTGGEDGLVDPMAYVAYVILALVLVFVLFFVIKNLFTNTDSLKNTLIGVGSFAVVLIIAYVISGGDAMSYTLQEGGFASESTSQLVGAGLVSFYLLLAIAAGAMIFAGAKRIISK
ncbi:hypothetical protein HSX10_11480 [Winogradskyella undariae]|uniref:hypothetical protein n=1 Tax=Winogradskyella TaxID=286104 RepID=UPI00156AD09C|nr:MULTISPECIES: hypothetical protein [Winogradskyella]NRR92188.1 hypothetical protein [Winogradskyella undariae]QXP80211.1 hypothetical protein H0I32_06175 [Winogradskyella sp. HaHa_3_26]